MKTISIKTYLALLSIGIASAILIIIVGILIPALADIRNTNEVLQAKKHDLVRAQERAADPEKSIEELEAITKRVKALDSATVEPKKELALIETFEKIAEKTGIKQTIKLQENNAKIYKFNLVNKGTFLNHISYLRELENLPYYVSIKKIEWSKNNESSITARFDATIYATIQ